MICNMKRATRFSCALLAAIGVVTLMGCSAETKLTPKEQASFKGTGEMPPEARAKMADMMQDAQAKMAADKSAQNGTGRNK